jgi:ATP-dependent Clp protease adaptor protein ClpS
MGEIIHRSVIKNLELSEVSVDNLTNCKIVVYNDEDNTFDWVIYCFCKYLKHTDEQAEQCAWLIHSKGRYNVKYGTKDKLIPYLEALLEAGLLAEIQ